LAPGNAFGICIRTQVTGPSKPVLVEKKAPIQGSGSTLLRFSTVPMPSWPKLSLLRGAHARQLAESVFPRIN
jgi:hypothetical protein